MADSFIGSDQAKELDITEKLQAVSNDKKKIEDTVGELDRLKRDTLLKTWEKVNVCVQLRSVCFISGTLNVYFVGTLGRSSLSYYPVTSRSCRRRRVKISWMG
jgi:hypothetical protein